VRRQRREDPAAPGYHHGDLRRVLLAATDALLTEAGLEGFTLREVARRAGVSHGAPAHHFGDMRGLLSAYAAEGFAQLAAAMAHRRAAASARPVDQLIATGIAYVDYALAHRARFQLMFRSDRLDPDCMKLAEAGDLAYSHLVDCIARIDPGSDADAVARRRRKSALAWSLVHGYATLMIDNRAFAAHAHGNRVQALAMVQTLLTCAHPAFVEPVRKP
jgi:AcrR family transcriptional regulator